jgi:hypothetical protein
VRSFRIFFTFVVWFFGSAAIGYFVAQALGAGVGTIIVVAASCLVGLLGFLFRLSYPVNQVLRIAEALLLWAVGSTLLGLLVVILVNPGHGAIMYMSFFWLIGLVAFIISISVIVRKRVQQVK